MIDVFNNLIEGLKGRVYSMIGRAILSIVNDGGAIQVVQAVPFDGEPRDDIERLQQYGFTGNPHPGAEAVIAFMGGNQDHGVVISVEDRRYRMTGLGTGEVAIYDDLKQSVHLTRSGIVVKGAGLPMLFTDTSKITLDADVDITGKTTVSKDVESLANIKAAQDISDQGGSHSMGSMRATYNGHDHNETQSVTEVPNQIM